MKQLFCCLLLALTVAGLRANDVHRIYNLEGGWHATCIPESAGQRAVEPIVLDNVRLPHNFDDYYGARQLTHGNLHGDAIYDISFRVYPVGNDVVHRLRIEGAGSYITVILNGDTLCAHRPAGRVVTTLPIPGHLPFARANRLRIICHHPSRITDMPWVCGGCSSEWGFSEGSQPLGLFRMVRVEELNQVHIQPFGVHVWSNPSCDTLFVDTEVENLSAQRQRRLNLRTTLAPQSDPSHMVATQSSRFTLEAGQVAVVHQVIPLDSAVQHWGPDHPFLYDVKTLITAPETEGIGQRSLDLWHTDFGFRNIQWGRQFLVDGQPVFINGICEYEHAFGHSHALTHDEIDHRALLVRRLGYNAFRDAHQPHNLRYQHDWNCLGIVNWAQFSAHIWYDTPAFRNNFKTLLRQWVRERRNDPSLVLWGLQNESTLPQDFAEECTAIIREMDPTCCQPGNPDNGRLVTTCNGGSGTDWNVVQNWSGTYGGKLENYGEELKRDNQLLNGEYGCWRTVGLHDDTLRTFNAKAPHSEEKFSMLLRSKMDQAWAVRDSVCGQYLWLMYSHDNPGRWQPDEALRLIDKVGPYNYKGLYTIWGQPTDFARQLLHDTLEATQSGPKGAILLRGIPDMLYLYRYNCGGDSLTDSWGQHWMGDDTRISTSWAQRPCFAADSLCPVLASQGVADGPVSVAFAGEVPYQLPDCDQALARTFRWGRQDLSFRFPVEPERQYTVEIYSIEPWYAYSGCRRYDIAVNGRTYCQDVDVARVSGGRNHLVRTTIYVPSGADSSLVITYPRVAVGQAVVCGIAISVLQSAAEGLRLPPLPQEVGYPYSVGLTWAALDTMVLPVTPKDYFPNHDGNLATQIKVPADPQDDGSVRFSFSTGLAHEYVMRFRYKNVTGAAVPSTWEVRSQVDHRVIAQGTLSFPVTPPKWKPVSTTTGSMINAGAYYLVLRPAQPLEFDNLTIE